MSSPCDDADRHRNAEHGHDRRCHRPALMHEQVGQQHAHQAHQRTDRKIDAAGDDDERRADAQDSEQRRAMDEILHISDAQESIAR